MATLPYNLSLWSGEVPSICTMNVSSPSPLSPSPLYHHLVAPPIHFHHVPSHLVSSYSNIFLAGWDMFKTPTYNFQIYSQNITCIQVGKEGREEETGGEERKEEGGDDVDIDKI